MSIIVSTNGGIIPDSHIAKSELGGEYLGWTGFPGWQKQAEHFGIHHLRWPAGNIAEDRIEGDNYAFDISQPNIVDNWPLWNGEARPGIAEMFEYSVATGSSFSMILPTGRYVELMRDNSEAAKIWIAQDIEVFAERLFSGEWGAVPNNFTIEIGAEYYSTDAWARNAHDPNIEVYFAAVFGEIVANLTEAETRYGENRFEVAVQTGRFQSNDDTAASQDGQRDDANVFIDAYIERGVADNIDAIVWHRYVYTFEQISHHTSLNLVSEHTLKDHVDMWEAAFERDLDLITGWASPDVDSEDVSSTDPNFDYGPRSAHNLLQMFSVLAANGADTSTLYGVDSPWHGAVSTGTNNPNEYEIFFHGEVYKLMANSLPGLMVTDRFEQNIVFVDSQNGMISNDAVNVFNFTDGTSNFVSFAAAWKLESPTIDIAYSHSPIDGAIYALTKIITPDTYDIDASASYETARISGDGGQLVINDVTAFSVVRTEFTADVDYFDFADESLVISNLAEGRSISFLTSSADQFEVAHSIGEHIVSGLEGNDRLFGSMQADIIIGGEGNDLVEAGSEGDLIYGDDLDEQLILNWLSSDFSLTDDFNFL